MPKSGQAPEILTVEQALEKVGNNNKYQLIMLITFMLVFLFSSFIQMGFPIIFHQAKFLCQVNEDCSQAAVCAKQTYTLSPDIKSIAYSFDLVCERKGILTTCFEAFLYGGFLGSLYYGQIIQRKGRKHAVLQSQVMMLGGLCLSLLSGSSVLFAFGVFFFNAGFRGFYNASLLTMSQITGQVTRATTPMIFSIGWAIGQIIVALIGMGISNWRIIFLLTIIPTIPLLYYSCVYTKQSPRFLITKHQFLEVKKILAEIANINEKRSYKIDLKEEQQYKNRMEGYNAVLPDTNISSTQKHHSYASLLMFSSIRIRILVVGVIWSLISLSYFISANGQINPKRSVSFNIALAGVIQIIAYIFSLVNSLNSGRVHFIKRLIIASSIVHLLYFFVQPHDQYTGIAKGLVMALDIGVRILMSIGNTFLAIYTIQLFPTSIRHFALGILGFITKLMYMLSFIFDNFFKERLINSNFILGLLFAGSYLLTTKLRQTKQTGFKDNLSQDGNNLLMNETTADLF